MLFHATRISNNRFTALWTIFRHFKTAQWRWREICRCCRSMITMPKLVLLIPATDHWTYILLTKTNVDLEESCRLDCSMGYAEAWNHYYPWHWKYTHRLGLRCEVVRWPPWASWFELRLRVKSLISVTVYWTYTHKWSGEYVLLVGGIRPACLSMKSLTSPTDNMY